MSTPSEQAEAMATIGGVLYPEVEVQLTGQDGNALVIIGAVSRELRRVGIDPAPFVEEATAGDYDHVLRTCLRWVTVL